LNLELLPVFVVVPVALVASYWDLCRGSIIPDWLTLPSIFGGILFHAFLGLVRGDLTLACFGGIGALLSFGIAYLLWLTGGWAGGDVKLFTAFGAWVPSYSPPHSLFLGYPLFPLTILFNSALLSLPAICIFAMIQKLRGRGAFYEEVKITELSEGDIPAELIYLSGEEVRRERPSMLVRGKWDKLLAHPRRAAGLTQEQVRELKSLVEKGKLENKIRIKKGIPFGPFLAAGLLWGLALGDLYSLLLSLLLGWPR